MFVLLMAVAAACWAQPRIDAVVNAASNSLSPAPNAPIAQGAMFISYGAGQGPASLVQAGAFPLPTTLSGTSIQVTVAGVTVDCIMIYTVASQVAAILPSNTPAGVGEIRLTYNGQTSAPAPIEVVASNPAIFTVNSRGFGDGILTFPDYGLVTPTRAANAGDALIIWATGLGPVTFAENQPPQAQDLTNIPLEVWAGGKQAQVLYKGRNPCCSALDQINVVIPQGVSGCGTQVFLKSGNFVSNAVNVALGAGGRNCTLSEASFGDADFQTVLARGSFRTGAVGVQRFTNHTLLEIPGFPTQNTTTRSDVGFAGFTEISGDLGLFVNQTPAMAELGGCVVFTEIPPVPAIQFRALDAGASIGIQGPNGNRNLNRGQENSYFAELGPGTPGNYLDPGRYTFTGPGGAEVGAINTAVDMAPELTWTNRENLRRITRANGAEVTWTGGNPNGEVDITGSSAIPLDDGRVVAASFHCRERTAAGRFRIPPHVLLQMPASGATGAGFPMPGNLSVASVTANFGNKPAGVDFFSASTSVAVGQTTIWE